MTQKIFEDKIELNSYSLFPIHHRKLTIDLKNSNIIVKDRFLWKSDIFFNTNNGLLTDTSKFVNERYLQLS
jgi:hypothetical protein